MRFRAGVLLAMMAVPSTLGLAWLGCAAGDDEVEGQPKRNTGDTSGLLDETTTPPGDGGGGGDGAPGDGAKPFACTGDVGTPNSCAAAIDLGTIAVGAKKNTADSLPLTGGDRWFKVKFETLENTAAHPRIKITSSDAALVLEVTKSCSGDTVACGDEDAFAVRIKDYEVVYRADPSADAEPGSDATADAFLPIVVGDGGTVYIRVFRTSGMPSGCNFQLDVSN